MLHVLHVARSYVVLYSIGLKAFLHRAYEGNVVAAQSVYKDLLKL
jgi:hypothetical protein